MRGCTVGKGEASSAADAAQSTCVEIVCLRQPQPDGAHHFRIRNPTDVLALRTFDIWTLTTLASATATTSPTHPE